MAKEPNRPAALPANAQWIGYKRLWVVERLDTQGQRAGVWEWWHADGFVYQREHYENGVLHGAYQRYRTADKIAIEANYVAGNLEGRYVHYYSDGTPAAVLQYQQGKLQGKCQYYITSETNPEVPQHLSKLRIVVYMVDLYYQQNIPLYGLYRNREGNKRFNNIGFPCPDGIPAEAHFNLVENCWEVADYVDGKIEGNCQRWDPQGKLLISKLFVQGEIQNTDRPDTVPAEAVWAEAQSVWLLGDKNEYGNQQGIWRCWDKRGLLLSDIQYDNGEKTGTFTLYTPSGRVWVSGQQTQGKWTGTICYYAYADAPFHDHAPCWNHKKAPAVLARNIDKIVEAESGTRSGWMYMSNDPNPLDNNGNKMPDNVPKTAHWNFMESCWEQATYSPKGNIEGHCMRWEAGTGTQLPALFYSDGKKRPAHLPVAARWQSNKKMWVVGDTNTDGQRHGQWQWYKEEGQIVLEEYYEKGDLKGISKRYFLDGTTAVEGRQEKGQWHGLVHYYRSDQEANVDMPKVYSPKITKISILYHHGQRLYGFLYIQNGLLVDNFGRMLPIALGLQAVHWNFGAECWELLHYNHAGKAEGTCRHWSSETGKLIMEAVYKDGCLDGTRRTYYRNGAIASEELYAMDASVSPHHFYRTSDKSLEMPHFSRKESERIWKKTVYYKADTMSVVERTAYYLQDGTPCRSNGLPILDIRVKDLFKGDPIDFLQTHWSTFLERWLDKAYKPLHQANSAARQSLFSRYYGESLPHELALYWDTIERAGFPVLFGNLHTAIHPLHRLDGWDKSGKNSVEQSILQAQSSYPFDFLTEWITGTITLDKAWAQPNAATNYSYLYQLHGTHPTSLVSAIRHDDHAKYYGTSMLGNFGTNLSAFLYYIAVCQAHSRLGILTDQEAEGCLKKVQQAIELTYTYNQAFPMEMNNAFWWRTRQIGFQATNSAQIWYNEYRWVIELLRGQFEPDTAVHAYIHTDTRRMQAQVLSGVKKPHFQQLFCWLWIAFWSDAPSLPDALTACRRSSAVLLQQSATLVQQFLDGRSQLGLVHIPETKKMINK